MYHCHTPLWPLYAFFHLCHVCLFLSLLIYPLPSSFVCLSLLVFPVYWTETCWYEARLHGHKGTSLWCFWSAARSDMSTAPPRTLQWLIMQYSAGTDNQRCTPTHVPSVNHTSMGTCTMQRDWSPCVGSAHSRVACLLDTREREWDGVCDFPFLALSFSFDSKMDDCNHRSHQWDRVEVYGAARHSHGKPAIRLMCHAAMGTMRCLFVGVGGRLLFRMHFLLSVSLLCSLLMYTTWKLPHKICAVFVNGTEKESVYVSQHRETTVSQYVFSDQYKYVRFHSDYTGFFHLLRELEADFSLHSQRMFLRETSVATQMRLLCL